IASRRGLVRSPLRSVAPTAVLQDDAGWRAAVAEARSAGLPLHRDRPKNWDAAGAVGAVLGLAAERGRQISVLDAGAARYSSVLPWLRLYGLGERPGALRGINLEFTRPVSRDGVRFEYGDATATGCPDRSIDALTCMSVIEHGVPLRPFLAEAARVLTPGGLLCVSTDYDQDPPDTSGITAYGSPVRIFGPDDIRAFVADAAAHGLELVGDLSAPGVLAHPQRPVHWRRTGLDYTFILLTFRRGD
ncbi:MAG: class I SAM-dependent methyltransferase, partial [Dermatophilaceae bacterium]